MQLIHSVCMALVKKQKSISNYHVSLRNTVYQPLFNLILNKGGVENHLS